MFKVNNKDTRTTTQNHFTPCSSVSIVNYEQVNAGWVLVHRNVRGCILGVSLIVKD